MKNILSLLCFLSLGLIFQSCSEDDANEPISEEQIPEYVWVATHTIGDFITEFGNREVTVDTIAISGIVISSDEAGNINKELIISDGNDAVSVNINGEKLYETYSLGQEVILKCVGLKLDSEDRTISKVDGSALDFPDTNEVILLTENQEDVLTRNFDIRDIQPEDINQYVRIINFQVEETEVGNPYVRSNERTKISHINDDGLEAQLVFNPGSSFDDLTIPDRAGDILGILTIEDDLPTITSLAPGDLSYTIPRRAPFEKRTFDFEDNNLPYQIMFPRNYDTTDEYPLVVFLHGAGERGTDNERQMAFGPNTFGSYSARTDYPAIVIFPQCPPDVMWSRRIKYNDEDGVLIFEFPVEDEPNYAMEMVIELVRDLIASEAVDEKRVYITGLSMGGIGTFEFSYYAPDLPAALAPMAGGHDSTLLKTYGQEIAFRIHHGANDGVVPARYSEQMFLKMVELGYDAEYFEEPGRGHEWNYVLNDSEYIKWIFEQTRD